MSKRRGRGEGSIVHLPDGRWKATFTLPGAAAGEKQRRRVVYGQDKKECMTRLAAARMEGARPLHEEAGSLTVAGWLDRWIEMRRVHLAPGTLDYYQHAVESHLKPALGHHALSKLTALDVSRAQTEWLRQGVTVGNQRQAITILRAALAHAHRLSLCGANVAKDVDKPPERRRQVRAMTAAQMGAFLDATRGSYLPMFTLLFDSGMRPGELFGLCWDDLNFDAGTVRIERTLNPRKRGRVATNREPKTASGHRTVKLAGRTVELLRQLRGERAGGERAFTVTHSAMRVAFHATCKRAGLPKSFRPYCTRHTSATLLIAAGVDLRTVSARLGHAKVEMTLRFYAASLQSQEDRAVLEMERILDKAESSTRLSTQPA